MIFVVIRDRALLDQISREAQTHIPSLRPFTMPDVFIGSELPCG
jgi:hypothetical protein